MGPGSNRGAAKAERGMQQKHSLHRPCSVTSKNSIFPSAAFSEMKIGILTCLVPLHLNDPFHFLPDPRALRWLGRRSVPGVAGGVPSSSAELLILSPSSPFLSAVPCVLCSISCQPQAPSPGTPPSPSSPALTSGTDLGSALMVTKFLGTASAFGS